MSHNPPPPGPHWQSPPPPTPFPRAPATTPPPSPFLILISLTYLPPTTPSLQTEFCLLCMYIYDLLISSGPRGFLPTRPRARTGNQEVAGAAVSRPLAQPACVPARESCFFAAALPPRHRVANAVAPCPHPSPTPARHRCTAAPPATQCSPQTPARAPARAPAPARVLSPLPPRRTARA